MEFPGCKDYVRVKELNGKVVKMTKHVLALTLKEAFLEFKSEYPEEELKFTSFVNLRPPNVLLRHQMPKNVCQCKYHTNVNFLISAVNKAVPEFSKTHHDLLAATSCSGDQSKEQEECQFGLCRECNKVSSYH